MSKPITEISFQNVFTTNFPGDPSGDVTPRQTPGVLWSAVQPTPVASPALAGWSEEMGATLGIQKPATKEELEVFSGNRMLPSMQPYAACYAGHQFGHWAGQLGDGRAITLGEMETPSGERWELQLKGAGPTPYSRRADGRAVLRSSLREFLASEAMYHLGVPTTRALSLVTTGDPVLRDMFYDGHPAYEPGAIVMRVAPTFLRFGSFEMPAARGEKENLQRLVDWTIDQYYPHLQGSNRLQSFFAEVVDKTAFLITEWMRVGFVHGVMNTDNMSILGLTIDYGPFSFVDQYDPQFTPNTTDLPGRRYAFGRQPSVAYWNLGCLANALAVLVEDTAPLSTALDSFEDRFLFHYYQMMAGKLGLDAVREADRDLVARFEGALSLLQPDMTLFYRLLGSMHPGWNEAQVLEHFAPSFYRHPSEAEAKQLHLLLEAYGGRLEENSIDREAARRKMESHNPYFIPRNYLLHQCIGELEKGETTLYNRLWAALREPYKEKDAAFFTRRPDWASNQAGCSQLSCSS